MTWAQGMKIPFVDSQKYQTIGRSIDSILDRGIRLNYNKSVDQLVYNGFNNFTGLVNDPNVVSSVAPNGAAGGAAWTSKTVDEILWDINKLITGLAGILFTGEPLVWINSNSAFVISSPSRVVSFCGIPTRT